MPVIGQAARPPPAKSQKRIDNDLSVTVVITPDSEEPGTVQEPEKEAQEVQVTSLQNMPEFSIMKMFGECSGMAYEVVQEPAKEEENFDVLRTFLYTLPGSYQ